MLLRLHRLGTDVTVLLDAAPSADWVAGCALELRHVVLAQHDARHALLVVLVTLINGVKVVSLRLELLVGKLVLLDLLELVLPVRDFEKHVLLVSNLEHFLQSCIFIELVQVAGLLSFWHTSTSVVLPCSLVIDHLHIRLNHKGIVFPSIVLLLLKKALLRFLHASKSSSDTLQALVFGAFLLLLAGSQVVAQHARSLLRVSIATLLVVQGLISARVVIVQSCVNDVLHLLDHLACRVVCPTSSTSRVSN